MEGIGLDNMLGAEEVERLFSGNQEAEPDDGKASAEEETSASEERNDETEETAEVDFSDLLGNQPESVGSEKNSEGNGDSPESNNGSGTPQENLFSSIARILRDKGVFPDLSDDSLKDIKDEEALEKLFNDKVTNMFEERQQRLEKALNSGAAPDEVQAYQNDLNILNSLNDRSFLDTLTKEGEEGENLRKRTLYQDYVNRGFSHERAIKLIEKSFADGSDIEDAKEAFNSCKEFYKNRVDDYEQELESRQKKQKADEEKQFSNLKKRILDTDSFYDGVKVDKNIRQKAYDAITKPIYKDDQGNYMNALQKYQRENPMEFMENVAMLYALTDGFKNVEKLTKKKVQAGIKKGFEEVASILNTTRRNGDGTLNLANTAPDDSERENWTLA